MQVLLTWSQLRLRVGDLAGAAEVARTAAGMLPQAPELWETSLRLAVAVAAAASASRDAEQASGCPTTSHGDSSGDDEEADAPGPSGRDDALIGATLEAVRACPRSEGLWLLAGQCLVAAGHNPGVLRTQLEVVLAQGPRGPTEVRNEGGERVCVGWLGMEECPSRCTLCMNDGGGQAVCT